MSDERDRFQDVRADHRARQERIIKKINTLCLDALKEAVATGRIAENEASLAEQAMLNLMVGQQISEKLHRDISIHSSDLADEFYQVLATVMKGVFFSGGLVITSKSLRKSRLDSAHKKVQEASNLYREAICYALTQPPSRPLGKSRGTDAIATRCLKAANQWLADYGHEPSLTKGKIQKRLERSPDQFPPLDKWQK